MLDIGVNVFIVQPSTEFEQLHDIINNSNCEIVYVDSINLANNVNWVKTNDIEITIEATTELINKGYKHFIFVTEDTDTLKVREERKNGFITATDKYEIEHTIVTITNSINVNELSSILSPHILNKDKVLVFGVNGKVLQKCFDALSTLNVNMPNQVGLIGFDDWDWTKYTTPKVSTIAPPNYDEGEVAAKMLINLVDKKDTKTQIVLNGKIKWCESTNVKLD